MSVETAFRYLCNILPLCPPAIRDAVAGGEVNGEVVRAAFARIDAPHVWPTTDEDMAAGAYRLAEHEAGLLGRSSVMVLASYHEAPTSVIISIRANPHFPGARIVEVLCPYADQHLYRRRGHERHTHGWPAGLEPDARGSLGTRVPHCDGATRGEEFLPRVELVLPNDWRTMVST